MLLTLSALLQELLQEHERQLDLSVDASHVPEGAHVPLTPVLAGERGVSFPQLVTEPLQLRAVLRARGAIFFTTRLPATEMAADRESSQAFPADVPPDASAWDQREVTAKLRR